MEAATSLKPVLVSKREAAALLAVSVRTVENLIARRHLAVRRVGKRVLIPYAALESFANGDGEASKQARAEVRASPCI